MTKRIYQPHNRCCAKKHGFRNHMTTRTGRAVISARRHRGRRQLAV